MVIRRGEVWWADLPDPVGAGPGYRRPVIVVQAEVLNRSELATVMVATCFSSLAGATLPSNVLLTPAESGLPRPSVVRLSQILTIDRGLLLERVGPLALPALKRIEAALLFSLDFDVSVRHRRGT